MHSAFEKFITNIRDLYSFEKKKKEKWAKRIAFLQKTRLTCQLNLYIYIYISTFLPCWNMIEYILFYFSFLIFHVIKNKFTFSYSFFVGFILRRNYPNNFWIYPGKRNIFLPLHSYFKVFFFNMYVVRARIRVHKQRVYYAQKFFSHVSPLEKHFFKRILEKAIKRQKILIYLRFSCWLPRLFSEAFRFQELEIFCSRSFRSNKLQ